MDLLIGKITAPVGIKGEVRVYPYFDYIEALSAVKQVKCGTNTYEVERIRVQGNMLVFKLAGIDDRNTSETMRNKEIYAEKSKINLPKDMYLDVDIIGMEVRKESGEVVGKVTNVTHNTAQDLYEITKPDDKSFLLPAVKAFVLDMNFEENVMTVRLIEGLDEL